jgi:hypothetical protein
MISSSWKNEVLLLPTRANYGLIQQQKEPPAFASGSKNLGENNQTTGRYRCR